MWRYVRFINNGNQAYLPGIIFPTASCGEIVNFPKTHSENCTAKHQSTNTWFKPMVRILKNMRSRLVDKGDISQDLALSHLVECMLWNVPNEKFGVSYADSFCNCFNWLSTTDRAKLTFANEQYLLLGQGNVQWPEANCASFLNALLTLWKEW